MINTNSKIYIAGHNGMLGSAILRELKKKGYKKIFVSKIPKEGPGIAINDRLLKASI